jgi:hypothetical protein
MREGRGVSEETVSLLTSAEDAVWKTSKLRMGLKGAR